MRLSWSFFKQSFLKQILTDGTHCIFVSLYVCMYVCVYVFHVLSYVSLSQGERYVMTIFGVLSFAEQGETQ